MKRLTSLIRKEFYHIFRDKRTLLILFGMPVVQILLFGYAITNEIKDAHIAILDQSNDEVSRRLTDKLVASGYFLPDGQAESIGDVEQLFKEGRIKMAVVVEPDFADKLQHEGGASVQLLADATDPNMANTLVNYATAIIQNFQLELNQPGQPPILVGAEVRLQYNPSLKGVFLFVPGLITILLMLVSAMMTSISIAREKETGTMEVLLASPMNPGQVIIAKVVPYFSLAFLDAVVVLLLGRYVFGVPIMGSVPLLLAEIMLFIIMALSLGILISTVAQTQQTALLLSLMGLMLPTILLSGFIFPIENMPLPLQIISHIIPARWFIVIEKAIMLKGVGIAYFWKETLILIGFTVFFIGVSIKKFNVRLG
ncbi:MAG: ABC transporter permease [Imperialibacter sp.]|uniref:ABC transporter permease n=1 Tax=Imperialibacter sp. TaxID=2038411 RepID=UPI0032F0413A